MRVTAGAKQVNDHSWTKILLAYAGAKKAKFSKKPVYFSKKICLTATEQGGLVRFPWLCLIRNAWQRRGIDGN
jgi:hypothetical protein